MREEYTQWHPAFCSAIKLELAENKEDLDYISEYNINTKPLQMDLLVIKKSQEVSINNEIGKIFLGHNIMEYKSPEDSLNVNTLIKVIGYGCLYKVNESYLNEIELDDITISLVREGYPRELFKWLKSKNCTIQEAFKGIYYIKKNGIFPIQIIVGSQLSQDNHLWLKSLSQKLTEQDVEKLILKIQKLSDKGDKDYAESILQVSVKENRSIFDRIKEGSDIEMRNYLMEFMQPEIDAVVKAATDKIERETAKNTAIQTAKRMLEQRVSYEICRASIDVDVVSDEELQAIYDEVVCVVN